MVNKLRKVSAKQIIRFLTVPYNLISQAILAKPLRNACVFLEKHGVAQTFDSCEMSMLQISKKKDVASF